MNDSTPEYCSDPTLATILLSSSFLCFLPNPKSDTTTDDATEGDEQQCSTFLAAAAAEWKKLVQDRLELGDVKFEVSSGITKLLRVLGRQFWMEKQPACKIMQAIAPPSPPPPPPPPPSSSSSPRAAGWVARLACVSDSAAQTLAPVHSSLCSISVSVLVLMAIYSQKEKFRFSIAIIRPNMKKNRQISTHGSSR